MPLRFSARIEQIGVNPFVWLSSEQATELAPGRRKPIPVVLWVNGSPRVGWKVSAMPAGDGRFRLYLNGVVRRASKTEVGDLAKFEVVFDARYHGGPLHSMPARFRRGLATSEAASMAWSALSPSRRKEILRYFANVKGDEVKRRNIERALRVLGGAQERFLGRLWNADGLDTIV